VERLEAFYKKYYQPDNAVLILTGRLDETRRSRWWPTRWEGPAPRAYTRPALHGRAPQDGERFVKLSRGAKGRNW